MEMHELIKRVWNDEELPEEWKTSILCPIYKKGDWIVAIIEALLF